MNYWKLLDMFLFVISFRCVVLFFVHASASLSSVLIFSDEYRYLSSPTVWHHWTREPRGRGGRGFASAAKTSEWLSKLFSSPTEPSWFQTEIPQRKYNLIFSCSISLESDCLQLQRTIKKMNMITSANNTKICYWRYRRWPEGESYVFYRWTLKLP